jgi:uncharacterized protein YxeA
MRKRIIFILVASVTVFVLGGVWLYNAFDLQGSNKFVVTNYNSAKKSYTLQYNQRWRSTNPNLVAEISQVQGKDASKVRIYDDRDKDGYWMEAVLTQLLVTISYEYSSEPEDPETRATAVYAVLPGSHLQELSKTIEIVEDGKKVQKLKDTPKEMSD